MLARVLGLSKDKQEEPSSSSRKRREGEKSQRKRSDTTGSSRKAPQGDERDRVFNPTSTSYSSTSRSPYPGAASASVASSYATAPNNNPDAPSAPPDLVRNASLADQMQRSKNGRDDRDRDADRDGKSRRRRDRSDSRDRSGKRRDRSRSRDREERRQDRKERKERKRNSEGGTERGLENPESNYKGLSRAGETSGPPGSFDNQIHSATFTQFPGQYDGGVPGLPVGPPGRPRPPVMSDHVPDQFPGQFPSGATAPYRPPLAVEEGGPGLAAEYYGDAGESVQTQPGVRPSAPSIIVGTQPHLMVASPIAAPPIEPSATGEVGAAASFFSGASFSPSTSPKPGTQPGRPSGRPSGPPLQTSTSGGTSNYAIPAALAAGTAAIGYVASHGATSNGQRPPDNSGRPNFPVGPSYSSAAPPNGQKPPPSPNNTSFPPGPQYTSAVPSYGPPGPPPSSVSTTQSYHTASAPIVPTIESAALGAAAGAAAGYMMGSHSSQQQPQPKPPRSSNGPLGTSGYVPTDFQRPPPSVQPSQGSYPGPSPQGPPQGSYSSYPEPQQSGKPPSSSSNLPLYIAGAAGAAGLAAAAYHHEHEHQTPPQNQPQNQTSGQSYSGTSTGMAHRHRHEGPLDKFIDFFRDPEGVGRFEEYTEYIGVCRYCFEPGSSPRDAPRKHYYNRKRRSNERLGASMRVDKESRYNRVSDDESRKTNNGSWLGAGLGAGLAGYGLSKVGETFFGSGAENKGGYSAASGRYNESTVSQGRRRYSNSPTRRSSTSYGVVNTSSDRITRRSRSRSKERKSSLGLGELAAVVAVGSAIAGSGSLGKQKEREPRYVPETLERRSSKKKPKRKQNGFFNFGNSSSSSTDLRLTETTGSDGYRKKKASKSRIKDHNDASAALIGLGAAAAALAAAEGRRSDRSDRDKRKAKAGAASRRSDRLPSGKERREQQVEEQVWIDEEDDASSVDSMLAYGFSRRSSQESLQSDASGTDKWSWRWGGKPKEKKKSNVKTDLEAAAEIAAGASGAALLAHEIGKNQKSSTASQPPLQYVHPISSSDPQYYEAGKSKEKKSNVKTDLEAAAGIAAGAAGAALLAHELGKKQTSSTKNQPPLQYVHPISSSDPSYYDATTYDSRQPQQNVPPAVIPLQHPQPKAPTSSVIYTSQAPYDYSYVAPTGPPAYPQQSQQHSYDQGYGGSATEYYETGPAPRDTQTGQRIRRRNSSPTPVVPEIVHIEPRSTKRTSTVRFEDIEGLEERKRRDGRQDWTKPDVSQPASESSRARDRVNVSDKQRKSTNVSVETKDERSRREAEIDARLERLRVEEAAAAAASSKKEKENDSWVTPILVGAAGAAVGAITAEEISKAKERREDREEQVSESRKPRKSFESEQQSKGSSQNAKRNEVEASIAKRAAELVRRTPSPTVPPVHEDYASFFAPDILSKSKDRQVSSESNHDNDIIAYSVPHIVTVEPAERGSVSTVQYSYKGFEGEEDFDPNLMRLPWQVPLLKLIKPTPPPSMAGSVAGSVRGDSSPIIRAEDVHDSDHDEPQHTPTSQESQAKSDVPDSPVEEEITREDIEREEMARHRMPGAFEDDIDFAATLAAGLQDSGFDPAIVIEDPTYHRRESPPGSEEAGFYRRPFYETVEDLTLDSPGTQGVPPVTGFVEDEELPPSPKDESKTVVPEPVTINSALNDNGKSQSPQTVIPGISKQDFVPLSSSSRGISKTTNNDNTVEPEFVEIVPRNIARNVGTGAGLAGVAAAVAAGAEAMKNKDGTRKAPEPLKATVSNSKAPTARDEAQTSKDGTRDTPEPRKETASNTKAPTVRDEALRSNDETRDARGPHKETASSTKAPIASDEARNIGIGAGLTGVAAAAVAGAETLRSKDSTRDAPEPRKDNINYTKAPIARDEAAAVPLPLDRDEDLDESDDRYESRIASDDRDEYDSADDFASTAATAPITGDSQLKQKRRRSKRKFSGYDDTTSMVSSPADFDTSREANGTTKKEKKGGVFGAFFSSKSSEPIPETTRGKGKDVSRDPPSRKGTRSSKDRRSKGDSGNFYNQPSEATTDLSRAEGNSRQSSSDKKPRPRSQEAGNADGDSGTATQESKTKRLSTQDDELDFISAYDDDPDEGPSRQQQQNEPLSFLGVRQEETEPPDITSATEDPGGRSRRWSLETARRDVADSHMGFDDSSTLQGDSQPASPPATSGTDRPLDNHPASPPATPAPDRRRLSMLQLSDPSHQAATPSPTAVPLLFRRVPSAMETSRSSPSTPGQSPMGPTSSTLSPRQRKDRPLSREFKTSKEFRPLWLVEKNNVTKLKQGPEEQYPSLPSSHSTSRASSVHGVDQEDQEDQFEGFEQEPPPGAVSPTTEAAFLERIRNQGFDFRPELYWPDILDSQQATPTRGTFHSGEDGTDDAISPTHVPPIRPFDLQRQTPVHYSEALSDLPALPPSRPTSPYNETSHHELPLMMVGAAAGVAAAAATDHSSRRGQESLQEEQMHSTLQSEVKGHERDMLVDQTTMDHVQSPRSSTQTVIHEPVLPSIADESPRNHEVPSAEKLLEHRWEDFRDLPELPPSRVASPYEEAPELGLPTLPLSTTSSSYEEPAKHLDTFPMLDLAAGAAAASAAGVALESSIQHGPSLHPVDKETGMPSSTGDAHGSDLAEGERISDGENIAEIPKLLTPILEHEPIAPFMVDEAVVSQEPHLAEGAPIYLWEEPRGLPELPSSRASSPYEEPIHHDTSLPIKEDATGIAAATATALAFEFASPHVQTTEHNEEANRVPDPVLGSQGRLVGAEKSFQDEILSETPSVSEQLAGDVVLGNTNEGMKADRSSTTEDIPEEWSGPSSYKAKKKAKKDRKGKGKDSNFDTPVIPAPGEAPVTLEDPQPFDDTINEPEATTTATDDRATPDTSKKGKNAKKSKGASRDIEKPRTPELLTTSEEQPRIIALASDDYATPATSKKVKKDKKNKRRTLDFQDTPSDVPSTPAEELPSHEREILEDDGPLERGVDKLGHSQEKTLSGGDIAAAAVAASDSAGVLGETIKQSGLSTEIEEPERLSRKASKKSKKDKRRSTGFAFDEEPSLSESQASEVPASDSTPLESQVEDQLLPSKKSKRGKKGKTAPTIEQLKDVPIEEDGSIEEGKRDTEDQTPFRLPVMGENQVAPEDVEPASIGLPLDDDLELLPSLPRSPASEPEHFERAKTADVPFMETHRDDAVPESATTHMPLYDNLELRLSPPENLEPAPEPHQTESNQIVPLEEKTELPEEIEPATIGLPHDDDLELLPSLPRSPVLVAEHIERTKTDHLPSIEVTRDGFLAAGAAATAMSLSDNLELHPSSLKTPEPVPEYFHTEDSRMSSLAEKFYEPKETEPATISLPHDDDLDLLPSLPRSPVLEPEHVERMTTNDVPLMETDRGESVTVEPAITHMPFYENLELRPSSPKNLDLNPEQSQTERSEVPEEIDPSTVILPHDDDLELLPSLPDSPMSKPTRESSPQPSYALGEAETKSANNAQPSQPVESLIESLPENQNATQEFNAAIESARDPHNETVVHEPTLSEEASIKDQDRLLHEHGEQGYPLRDFADADLRPEIAAPGKPVAEDTLQVNQRTSLEYAALGAAVGATGLSLLERSKQSDLPATTVSEATKDVDEEAPNLTGEQDLSTDYLEDTVDEPEGFVPPFLKSVRTNKRKNIARSASSYQKTVEALEPKSKSVKFLDEQSLHALPEERDESSKSSLWEEAAKISLPRGNDEDLSETDMHRAEMPDVASKAGEYDYFAPAHSKPDLVDEGTIREKEMFAQALDEGVRNPLPDDREDDYLDELELKPESTHEYRPVEPKQTHESSATRMLLDFEAMHTPLPDDEEVDYLEAPSNEKYVPTVAEETQSATKEVGDFVLPVVAAMGGVEVAKDLEEQVDDSTSKSKKKQSKKDKKKGKTSQSSDWTQDSPGTSTPLISETPETRLPLEDEAAMSTEEPRDELLADAEGPTLLTRKQSKKGKKGQSLDWTQDSFGTSTPTVLETPESQVPLKAEPIRSRKEARNETQTFPVEEALAGAGVVAAGAAALLTRKQSKKNKNKSKFSASEDTEEPTEPVDDPQDEPELPLVVDEPREEPTLLSRKQSKKDKKKGKKLQPVDWTEDTSGTSTPAILEEPISLAAEKEDAPGSMDEAQTSSLPTPTPLPEAQEPTREIEQADEQQELLKPMEEVSEKSQLPVVIETALPGAGVAAGAAELLTRKKSKKAKKKGKYSAFEDTEEPVQQEQETTMLVDDAPVERELPATIDEPLLEAEEPLGLTRKQSKKDKKKAKKSQPIDWTEGASGSSTPAIAEESVSLVTPEEEPSRSMDEVQASSSHIPAPFLNTEEPTAPVKQAEEHPEPVKSIEEIPRQVHESSAPRMLPDFEAMHTPLPEDDEADYLETPSIEDHLPTVAEEPQSVAKEVGELVLPAVAVVGGVEAAKDLEEPSQLLDSTQVSKETSDPAILQTPETHLPLKDEAAMPTEEPRDEPVEESTLLTRKQSEKDKKKGKKGQSLEWTQDSTETSTPTALETPETQLQLENEATRSTEEAREVAQTLPIAVESPADTEESTPVTRKQSKKDKKKGKKGQPLDWTEDSTGASTPTVLETPEPQLPLEDKPTMPPEEARDDTQTFPVEEALAGAGAVAGAAAFLTRKQSKKDKKKGKSLAFEDNEEPTRPMDETQDEPESPPIVDGPLEEPTSLSRKQSKKDKKKGKKLQPVDWTKGTSGASTPAIVEEHVDLAPREDEPSRSMDEAHTPSKTLLTPPPEDQEPTRAIKAAEEKREPLQSMEEVSEKSQLPVVIETALAGAGVAAGAAELFTRKKSKKDKKKGKYSAYEDTEESVQQEQETVTSIDDTPVERELPSAMDEPLLEAEESAALTRKQSKRDKKKSKKAQAVDWTEGTSGTSTPAVLETPETRVALEHGSSASMEPATHAHLIQESARSTEGGNDESSLPVLEETIAGAGAAIGAGALLAHESSSFDISEPAHDQEQRKQEPPKSDAEVQPDFAALPQDEELFSQRQAREHATVTEVVPSDTPVATFDGPPFESTDPILLSHMEEGKSMVYDEPQQSGRSVVEPQEEIRVGHEMSEPVSVAKESMLTHEENPTESSKHDEDRSELLVTADKALVGAATAIGGVALVSRKQSKKDNKKSKKTQALDWSEDSTGMSTPATQDEPEPQISHELESFKAMEEVPTSSTLPEIAAGPSVEAGRESELPVVADEALVGVGAAAVGADLLLRKKSKKDKKKSKKSQALDWSGDSTGFCTPATQDEPESQTLREMESFKSIEEVPSSSNFPEEAAGPSIEDTRDQPLVESTKSDPLGRKKSKKDKKKGKAWVEYPEEQGSEEQLQEQPATSFNETKDDLEPPHLVEEPVVAPERMKSKKDKKKGKYTAFEDTEEQGQMEQELPKSMEEAQEEPDLPLAVNEPTFEAEDPLLARKQKKKDKKKGKAYQALDRTEDSTGTSTPAFLETPQSNVEEGVAGASGAMLLAGGLLASESIANESSPEEKDVYTSKKSKKDKKKAKKEKFVPFTEEEMQEPTPTAQEMQSMEDERTLFAPVEDTPEDEFQRSLVEKEIRRAPLHVSTNFGEEALPESTMEIHKVADDFPPSEDTQLVTAEEAPEMPISATIPHSGLASMAGQALPTVEENRALDMEPAILSSYPEKHQVSPVLDSSASLEREEMSIPTEQVSAAEQADLQDFGTVKRKKSKKSKKQPSLDTWQDETRAEGSGGTPYYDDRPELPSESSYEQQSLNVEPISREGLGQQVSYDTANRTMEQGEYFESSRADDPRHEQEGTHDNSKPFFDGREPELAAFGATALGAAVLTHEAVQHHDLLSPVPTEEVSDAVPRRRSWLGKKRKGDVSPHPGDRTPSSHSSRSLGLLPGDAGYHEHASAGHRSPSLHSPRSMGMLTGDVEHHEHAHEGQRSPSLHSQRSLGLLPGDIHHGHASQLESQEFAERSFSRGQAEGENTKEYRSFQERRASPMAIEEPRSLAEEKQDRGKVTRKPVNIPEQFQAESSSQSEKQKAIERAAAKASAVAAGVALFETLHHRGSVAETEPVRRKSLAKKGTSVDRESTSFASTSAAPEVPRDLGHREYMSTRDLNRDSAVHVADSPLTGEPTPYYQSVRDSGYQGTEASPTFQERRGRDSSHKESVLSRDSFVPEAGPHPTSVRDSGTSFDTTNRSSIETPLNISIEVDPTYDVSVSRPEHGHYHRNVVTEVHDRDSGEQLPVQYRELPASPTPTSHGKRQPSPVESETKPRSSELFQSSPSTRDNMISSPMFQQTSPSHGRSEHRQDHATSRNINDYTSPTRKPLHPTNIQATLEPVKSLFGGPVGISSDAQGLISPPRTPLSSTRRQLDPIDEIGSEQITVHKHSRASSDFSLPEHALKSQRRSLTAHDINQARVRSPLAESTRDIAPISMDEIDSRLSWPAVDDEAHHVDLVRSKSRNTESSRHSSGHHPLLPAVAGAALAGTVLASDIAKHHETDFRSVSGASVRSNDSISAIIKESDSPKSGTPPLRRVDRSVSSDLRAANKRSEAKKLAKSAETRGIDLEPPIIASSSTYDPVNDKGKGRIVKMTDVYEGWGDVNDSPRSPTRPASIRKRQSMQFIEMQTRLEQLASENRSLVDAKTRAERDLEQTVQNREELKNALTNAIESRDQYLKAKDEELTELRKLVDELQNQVSQLTEHNENLQGSSRDITADHEERYNQLQDEHATVHQSWQETTQELEDLKTKHASLSGGLEGIVRHEVEIALSAKNAELQQMRSELESAKEQVRTLQAQILASRGSDDVLIARDEDYFDNACQSLCQHVQQWVLRFSKFSDSKICHSIDNIADDKIIERFENAILDGSEVDTYLKDRIKRRDVFMSVVMTMVWEYVFTRYLFGMDREQRQKLKILEKTLNEVGPARAVNKWRATTLTMLSKRDAFQNQRENDTEAVVQEIYDTLATLLTPPAHLVQPCIDSLRKVLSTAVDLAIEMRTQRAEYVMLPPLQPEYDTSGELVRKVFFNASLMNERSGNTTSNEDLQAQQAVVRMVLFPLVVKKGDDEGIGDEEIVVCPAQVLVARDDDRRSGKKGVRAVSGQGMEGMQSVQSFAPVDAAMGRPF